MTVEKNHDEARWTAAGCPTSDGKPVPIPYQCACGLDACYGYNGRWYCTGCHQSRLRGEHR